MNYKKHYDLLIDRAKTRLIEGYAEKHRIIPGCMGGTYAADNVVRLTPEEHYVAHQLLVKLYPKHNGLVTAAKMMTVTSNAHGDNRSNNKQYGWLKKKYLKICRARVGKKNPSYGKSWYHNPSTNDNGKFLKECVPHGWIIGRSPKNYCPDCNTRISKSSKTCALHRKNIKRKEKMLATKTFYVELYNKFINGSYDSISEFVQMQQIDLTIQSVSYGFITHVDGYVKQQGKSKKYRASRSSIG